MQPPSDMQNMHSMCPSNTNNANDLEDNSSACVIAMQDESVATMSAPNIQAIDANVNDFSVHEAKCNYPIITMREDHLLICLSSLCTQANVPLYLLDDIMEIFH